MYRERYFKCENQSLSDIEFQSYNLLLLYPPFIEVFLRSSEIINELQFSFTIHTSQTVFDIDLRPLNHIKFPFNFTLIIDIASHPTDILFRTHQWFKRTFYLYSKKPNYFQFVSYWQITNKNLVENNDIICYHFTTTEIKNTDEVDYNVSYTCPVEECSIDKNETRICLGLTPCLNMGDQTLLCRIDRLRSTDQFNTKISFLYTDVVITTTDTRKHTLHRFSEYLLYSCIAQRLVIIVIHGRLEIPALNSTSFNCSHSLV
jgi:hypothetical protein